MFTNKLVVDDREAIFSFSFPLSDLTCHVLPPYLSFYVQLVLVSAFFYRYVRSDAAWYSLVNMKINKLFGLQTGILLTMGMFIYKFIVNNTKDVKSTKYLISFGLVLPIILYEPIYIIQILDIENRALRMFLLALPITASLRLLEATFGSIPTGAEKSFSHFLSYFACLMGCKFDEQTHDPIPVTKAYFVQQVSKLLLHFGFITVLISLLTHHDYEFLNVDIPSYSMDHRFHDLFSWNHLVNNYLMTRE